MANKKKPEHGKTKQECDDFLKTKGTLREEIIVEEIPAEGIIAELKIANLTKFPIFSSAIPGKKVHKFQKMFPLILRKNWNYFRSLHNISMGFLEKKRF